MTTMLREKKVVILLVEDDPGDRRLTTRALARGKLRNEIHIAEDGEEALDYLFRRGPYSDPATSPRPDLVLLDLNLPKIHGREVLAEIRACPELRHLLVVVLTTSEQEEDILRSYDLGVNSYITKPVTFDRFVEVVQVLQDYWFQVVLLPGGA